MENTHGYRLERWMAVLLGLLFFLPFVARADDLLFTGNFHGDEVKHVSGEEFLALVQLDDCRWFLQPTRIRVERQNDPIVDEPHERTGKRVEVVGGGDAILVRGRHLSAGLVTPASPDGADLTISTTTALKLGHVTSTLRFVCGTVANAGGELPCHLMLATGGIEQEVVEFPAYRDEHGKIELPDLSPELIFAGDLDRDGKLDLIIDIANHYNGWDPALYLSTAAPDGALVAKVAQMITSGC